MKSCHRSLDSVLYNYPLNVDNDEQKWKECRKMHIISFLCFYVELEVGKEENDMHLMHVRSFRQISCWRNTDKRWSRREPWNGSLEFVLLSEKYISWDGSNGKRLEGIRGSVIRNFVESIHGVCNIYALFVECIVFFVWEEGFLLLFRGFNSTHVQLRENFSPLWNSKTSML